MGIIHMNGRIYDPKLGRFLQADPVIQAPKNSQNLNRYSYVLNNPLSYTDPTGNSFKSFWKKIRPFVAIAITYWNPAGYIFENAILQGAATGFIAGGVASGSMKGALVGAFTGAAFGAIRVSGLDDYTKTLLAGAAGGIASELQGDKFGHGFLSAGVGYGLGIATQGKQSFDIFMVTSIVGGTLSELTGGKFANGALSAGFAYVVAAIGSSRSVPRDMADGSGSEPADIRDYMSKNADWADSIEIHEGENSTTIKISLTVSYDGSIPDKAAQEYVNAIEKEWNKIIVDGGHTYTIQTNLTIIGENTIAGFAPGQLSIVRCSKCRDLNALGMGDVGGSDLSP